MKTKRWLVILGGFLGWFILNTLVYALLNLPDTPDRQLNTNMGTIWSGIIFANLAILLLLAIFSKTMWMAIIMGPKNRMKGLCLNRNTPHNNPNLFYGLPVQYPICPQHHFRQGDLLSSRNIPS